MDTHALAQHPPSTSRTGRTRARPGPSALAQCFLCSAWAVLLGYGPYSGTSILLKVRPPTGEPDAGDPPVRFGGRGNRDHSVPPTPIAISEEQCLVACPVGGNEPVGGHGQRG